MPVVSSLADRFTSTVAPDRAWRTLGGLGARVWFGFGPMGSGGRFGEENWLARLIGKTVFHRKVQQYNHMVKDEEEYEEALAEEAAEELPAKEDGEAGAEK